MSSGRGTATRTGRDPGRIDGVRRVPEDLLRRPFTRSEALDLGLTRSMLETRRFERVFPRVYRHRDHVMTHADWVAAARLSLPGEALLTGLTRIQTLGLDDGPWFPLHFVVPDDRHRPRDRIFLHRTRALPPSADGATSVAAAFLAYCSLARVVDAVRIGDWLLHHGHLDPADVTALALAQLWRDGAHEALWVLPHLDGRSRSLPESETRAVLTFAGLPRPEVNAVVPGLGAVVVGDLLFREQRLVVEYEGRHHQLDRSQYTSDIDRYRVLRAGGARYVQVTAEKLARPRSVVGEVYRELVAAGYAGPPPDFGHTWHGLLARVSALVGPRRDRVLENAR